MFLFIGLGMAAGLIVGGLLGYLFAALHYNSKMDEAQKKWSAEKKRLREALRKAKTALPPEQLPERRQIPAPKPVKPEKQPETPEPEAAPEEELPPPETQEERIARIHRDFCPVDTLSMEFQYSFPDSLMFQPGRGFQRNAANEVLPDAQTLSRANSAQGYAMSGMFRAYDVIYKGRKFTFEQIMEGKMGDAYVRIESVPARAVIEATGHYGYYNLKQKGKMEVVDIQ